MKHVCLCVLLFADRFDLFNEKYDVAGSSDLRSIFLSINNDIHGRYLAEVPAAMGMLPSSYRGG